MAAKNVELSVKGDMLTIKIDLSKDFGTSSSGKTRIVATTSGNMDIPEHSGMKIGLNVFRKE